MRLAQAELLFLALPTHTRLVVVKHLVHKIASLKASRQPLQPFPVYDK
jgi:hypothetical protein